MMSTDWKIVLRAPCRACDAMCAKCASGEGCAWGSRLAAALAALGGRGLAAALAAFPAPRCPARVRQCPVHFAS